MQLRGRYNQLNSPVRAAAVLSAKAIALGIVMNWASLMIWGGRQGQGEGRAVIQALAESEQIWIVTLSELKQNC